MRKLSRILVPTDFSPSANQALANALSLARMHGAEVWLLRVIVVQTYDPFSLGYHLPDPSTLREYLEQAAMEAMEEVLSRHDTEGVTVRRVCLGQQKAGPAIVEYAGVKGADFISMGTHGRKGLTHLLLGSTAEEVVRRATCPVMVAREQVGEVAEPSWRHVLLPVDFSGYSLRVFDEARVFAKEHGAELHLLHVVAPASDFKLRSARTASPRASEAQARAEADARLRRLVDKADCSQVHIQIHTAFGQPAREIVEFASRFAIELIAIPTHGLSGLSRFFLGSIAEKVVRHSPCPVLVFRAFPPSEAPQPD